MLHITKLFLNNGNHFYTKTKSSKMVFSDNENKSRLKEMWKCNEHRTKGNMPSNIKHREVTATVQDISF